MPSSRYHSKVLRFVTQQSLKLRDRTLQRMRKIKLATIWGTQILLYPFYVIFQSARLVGKQLEQTARQVFPKLIAAIDPDQASKSPNPRQPPLPPKSDRPIENILNMLEEALRLSNISFDRNQANGQNPTLLSKTMEQKSLQSQSVLGFWPSTQSTAPEGRPTPSPSQEGRPTPSPSQEGRPTPSPSQEGRPTPSPSQEGRPTPSPSQEGNRNTLTPEHPNARTPQRPNALTKIQNPKSKIQNSSIRGLATLLDQKQLVLVDTENQIHNVLSGEQQAALQQQIVFEVANYWRNRRQFAAFNSSANSPLGHRFLPLPPERDTMLPPVRYLRRFIAWMQTSPVAIATNVFQESTLVPQPPGNIDLNPMEMARFGLAHTGALVPLAPLPNVGYALNSMPSLELQSKRKSWWDKILDWIIAPPPSSIQASTVADGTPGQQHPRMPSLSFPNSLTPTLGDVPAPIPGNTPNRLNTLPVELTRNLWFDPDYQGRAQGWLNANQINQIRRQREFPPILPSLPARVSPMVQASILNASYGSIEASLNEMTEAGLITTHVSHIINEDDLSLSGHFAESAAALLNSPDGIPDPVSLEAYLAHHGAAYDFRRTEDPSVDRNVLYRVSADAETSVQDEAGMVSLNIPGQSNTDMTNTWLDTTAEVVGYEKHPLERLLGWVDLGMAWIEQRIATAWYWVRDRF